MKHGAQNVLLKEIPHQVKVMIMCIILQNQAHISDMIVVETVFGGEHGA
jgi:hypothetical protein